MSVDRAFLNARKMRNPEQAHRETLEVLADWRTMRLRTALGLRFKSTERIVMRRPAWMPRRLYLWLLSTLVIEGEMPEIERGRRA